MQDKASVLIVDDDPQTLLLCGSMLQKEGIRNVLTLDTGTDVIEKLRAQKTSVVILDLKMPGISGEEILAEIGFAFPEIPVIVMTSVDDAETAIACLKNGAFDYLIKPAKRERLISSVNKAIELHLIRSEFNLLKKSMLTDTFSDPSAFEGIVTQSKKMQALFHYMEAISASSAPVLITGETGVGKELFARALHKLCCKESNFVTINVAGLDDTLFSDTLFGHKKGAYSGADSQRDGMLNKARHGMIFLDEIGDLHETSQVKLLRLLQEGEFYKLGSDNPEYIKCRVVMATNHDLKALVEKGKFRKDLYFRIHTHHIEIPPLRERTEDIPALVNYFVSKTACSIGKKIPEISNPIYNYLSRYYFPGNVRELESIICDAVVKETTGVLTKDLFRFFDRSFPKTEDEISKETGICDIFGKIPTLKEMENALIREALDQFKGNQATAAKSLGISRQALNQRLNRK